jgi:alpha-L-arabinofuranosidase
MDVRQGDRYDFNVHARTPTQGLKLKVELLSASGAVLGSVLLDGIGSDWQKHSTTLTATGTELKGKLRITLVGSGAVDVDMVSLFPQRTWKNRAGGLRADVVQLLADMKPGFFRFPGGCIVEGSELDKRYQWKNTIGPIEERPILINRWNSEFKHRSTPDYFQTFGLGFFEYFQLCEDIGAAPLPILNCGMACQFNSGELVPVNELEPYIQDVIDLSWFDNLNVVATPNYHAQRLFSRNRGDVSLPVALTDRRPAPPPTGRVGLATYRTSAEFKDIQVTGRGRDTFEAELRGEIILKVVNSRAAAAEAHLRLNGIQRIAPDIQATVLTGDPDEVNSMEEPDRLWPVPVTLRAESPEINHIFPPHSLTVLRVGTPN